MKNNHRSGPSGFTLIELLAVITIIVILAGLVVGGMGYVNEKQARSKAQTQIALLSKGIEEYKLDMGFYPYTANKSSASGSTGTGTSSILYNTLFFEGYDFITNNTTSTNNPPKATRIYIADLDPTSTKQGWVDLITSTSGTPKPVANKPIKDPWGNEYCYRSAWALPPASGNATANSGTVNPDFDLWSMGKDGQTAAGVTPGQLSDKKNLDDIRNF